jgi:hypothetical protein
MTFAEAKQKKFNAESNLPPKMMAIDQLVKAAFKLNISKYPCDLQWRWETQLLQSNILVGIAFTPRFSNARKFTVEVDSSKVIPTGFPWIRWDETSLNIG